MGRRSCAAKRTISGAKARASAPDVTRGARSRKQTIDPPARPVGRQADPFVHRMLEDAQIARGIEVEARVAAISKRVEVDRKGDRAKAPLFKDAHRAWHVKGRGHEKPALRGFGVDDRRGEAGVLVRIARFLLDRHPAGRDAKRRDQLSRLKRFG